MMTLTKIMEELGCNLSMAQRVKDLMAKASFAEARGSAATPCVVKALDCMELWMKSDVEMFKDAPFRKNLEHRLRTVRAVRRLMKLPPNDPSSGTPDVRREPR